VPNAGHQALVTLAERVPTLTLITQNVDSLHQRAGSRDVLELHGNLARVKCSAEGTSIDQWEDGDEVPPRCPHCGALLRPDVVWFGEQLPEQILQQAAVAAASCDIFFSIGTSGVVEPAASLAHLALRRGSRVILVNLEETSLRTEGVDFLQGPAGKVLPALVEAAWPLSK
jgi:NAD-dependent deacetylase